MQYTLKRTARSRGIRVRVLLGGEIVVTAGYTITESEISDFLYQHRRWLGIHVKDMQERAQYLHDYNGDTKILLHGTVYDVEYIEATGESTFDGTRVVIYTTGERHKALERWYKAYATEYLTRMYSEIAHDIVPMRVKSVKTYYGICYTGSRGSHIHLNTALVHADDECIRYVIHHEMVHLKVPNHSAKFYRELERLEPNHREIQMRLRRTVKM